MMTDPRRHRHVVAVDGDRLTYVCGCVNAIDAASGALRCVAKCAAHRAEARDPATLDEAYYREMGVLDPDAPTRYVGQLTEALGPLPRAAAPGWALEIGCGKSPYIRAVEAAGYWYVGVDPSPWACWAMEFAPGRSRARQEEFGPGFAAAVPFGLILAAHAFEHLADAPGAIRRCAELLRPGGELWAIVPDDEDPLNPDHMFYFNTNSLRYYIEGAGLVVQRMAVRRYIERENFIYCRARKPSA